MTTFTAFEDYTPPSWSARPAINFYFEIIRNGLQIEKIQLNQKAMYLVGKNSDICDIVFDNPSISRKHAVIQNKVNNECYIYDLGSQNGTFVNNRKIPTKLFHKLNIYDQVKFGSSSRLYIFRCSELESEDSAQQEQKIQERENKKKAKQEYRSLKDQYLNLLMKDPEFSYLKPQNRSRGNQDDDGITWGMIDEDEIYRYQQEQEYPLESQILKQLPGLSEQQLDKIKQYDDKSTKFRVVQDELDDLITKERNNFGLEESLKKKKEKLQNKQIDLSNELDQADEQLRFLLFGDKNHQKRIINTKNEVNSSEEDEYYDNTLSKTQKKQKILSVEQINPLENTTKSYTDLKNHLDELIDMRTKIHQEIIDLGIQNENAQKLQIENDFEDALDSFMKTTVSTLYNESKPKLMARISDIQKEIDVVQSQLLTVKPDVNKGLQFGDMFQNENTQIQIESTKKNNVAQSQSQQSGISQTLGRLKQISKNNTETVEDDDILLEKANKYFTERSQKEKEMEIAKAKQLEADLRRKERLLMLDQDEPQYQGQNNNQKNSKQYGVFSKPHSRHFKEKEIEDDNIIDIIQFQ